MAITLKQIKTIVIVLIVLFVIAGMLFWIFKARFTGLFNKSGSAHSSRFGSANRVAGDQSTRPDKTGNSDNQDDSFLKRITNLFSTTTASTSEKDSNDTSFANENSNRTEENKNNTASASNDTNKSNNNNE